MRTQLILILAMVILSSCFHSNGDNSASGEMIEEVNNQIDSTDLVEVNDLVISVLEWTDSDNNFELLPVKADDNDSIYHFDLDKLKSNIEILNKTGFFSKEFIDNYNEIILTLDKKLKGKEFEYGDWLVGDLPIFCFANDVSPWFKAQDVFPYDLIRVALINESGNLIWKHGFLEKDPYNYWKDYKYSFRVVKEGSKWKISYLEGFDYEKGIKEAGECS